MSDQLIRLSVKYLLDELVYLVSVGETVKREIPNWLVDHHLLPLAAEISLDHKMVESALIAEPEIDTIEELCDFLYDGRRPRVVNRFAISPEF